MTKYIVQGLFSPDYHAWVDIDKFNKLDTAKESYARHT